MKEFIYEMITSALAFISMLMIVALLMVFGGIQFPNPALPDAPTSNQIVEKPSMVINGIKFEIEE